MNPVIARYSASLKNTSYEKVAIFDSWLDLSYVRAINDVDTYSISLSADDPRCELFELDGMFSIHRCIPSLGVDWYEEFVGLHRFSRYTTNDNGEEIFTSIGVGLNDFLARTIINYKEGTIKAEKNDRAETVIKEYVLENCGNESLSAVPYERIVDGVLPDFEVESSLGLGSMWEGSKAFENLLDTIKDIAKSSDLDYAVIFDPILRKFIFKTYQYQLGEDRTTLGLNPVTGLNIAGNSPVVFSLNNGTLQQAEYLFDRTSESNVVSVLGDGDGATREVQVVQRSTITDSPWNRREIARPQGGFISQMQQAGSDLLDEASAKEVINFLTLQQPSQAYGLHYNLGDKVTIYFRGQEYHKRLIGSSNKVSKVEELSFTFSDA